MNQKDTDGKQYAASDEKDGQQFFSWSGESDKRLQQCEKQREVSGVDHMDMSVHLGTSVFQYPPEMREYILHRSRVLRSNSPRGGNQRLTLQSAILMQKEHCKNVPEKHPSGDKRNPT
jgi:hypothetical protein